MRDLLLHKPGTKIQEIVRSPVLQVETGMPQLYAAQVLQKHHYLGMPVVDREQRLVGVVRADNVIKIFRREADDDIARLIGTSPDEMKTTSIRRIIFARLPWFFVSIASGLLCAAISGIFQNSIGTIVTLFLFVPIVLGLSESTGVQGATIMVRNIAVGKTTFKNLGLLLLREAVVGVSIGIACGVIVGFLASYWQGSAILGVALASSMTVAIMFSALIGLLMPLLFMELKIDPTLATGPLVLAICDIQTLFVYFTLSIAIMR
jgi:magnesium transporter